MPKSIARPTIYSGLAFAVWIFASAAALAEPRCLCRYAAQLYDQGDCVCMTTSAGPRLACCGRVLNNSSWEFLANGCGVAHNAVMGTQSVSTLHSRLPDELPVPIQQAKLAD